MLSPPSPPTDNLYKFMSLSGLLIIAGSLIVFDHAYKIELRIAEQKVTQEDIRDSTKDLKWELNYLKGITKKIENSRNQITSKELDILESKLGEIMSKDSSIKLKQLPSKREIARLEVELKWLQRYVNLSTSGLLFGLSISVLGFLLWYNKVQKFLDKKIQEEAINIIDDCK